MMSNATKTGLLFTFAVLINLIIQLILMCVIQVMNITQISTQLFIILQIVLPILMLVGTYLVLKYAFREKQVVRIFQMRKINLKQIIFAVLIGICIYFTTAFVGAVFEYLFRNLNGSNIILPSVDSIGMLAIMTVVMCVLPAISEEMIFRGAFMFYSKDNKLFAVIFSALCFGLIHMNVYQVGYAFIAGLIFGSLFLVFKSTIFVIIVHFMNNFITVIKLYFIDAKNMSFSQNLLGLSNFEVIAGAICLMVFLNVFIIILKKNINHADGENQETTAPLRVKEAVRPAILGIVITVLMMIAVLLMS